MKQIRMIAIQIMYDVSSKTQILVGLGTARSAWAEPPTRRGARHEKA